MDSATPSLLLSTAQHPPSQRRAWLQQAIAESYTHVSVSPSGKLPLFNEMRIYPWQSLQLSIISSNGIQIQRQAGECDKISQDAYFAVVLLSGQYLLEQQGRETFLQAGDIALYDATRPHRIQCPGPFSKLIISIPRTLLRQSLAGVEHCTARAISHQHGMGAISSSFLQSAARYVSSLQQADFAALAPQALNLISAALNSIKPEDAVIGRCRSLSLYMAKQFIEQHLHQTQLDSSLIAAGTGYSSRYLNALFAEEGSAMMRYVWQRRLEKCRQDLASQELRGQSISTIAMHWGFNDLAHFSRRFHLAFGSSPRAYRQQAQADEHQAGSTS